MFKCFRNEKQYDIKIHESDLSVNIMYEVRLVIKGINLIDINISFLF